ncbi:MAG: homoserine kinase [Betaproteobacteria bacterium]|nr:homoserine kinase [Betaproteobacteria bacterium]
MSVFTKVSENDLAAWLRQYSVGHLKGFEGIRAGIENSNFFVTTTHGEYVLTLFERLGPDALPFYLDLMAHLSSHGLPCPKPIASLENAFLGELNGKPAALVTRVAGGPVQDPTEAHCAAVGEVLADLHLAGRSFPGRLDNLRGATWWEATAPELLPFLDDAQRSLLMSEIRFQHDRPPETLPRGIVHADLFRDNVLFDGERIGGVIDFYFACIDVLLYDVAIAVNDWCLREDCTLDVRRGRALLEGYAATRPFVADERAFWPVMLRAGALRFWVSRLYDYHLPRPGELTHAHDPGRFELILRNHVASTQEMASTLPLT